MALPEPKGMTVVTAMALHQAQIGLSSTDQPTSDAAETVLSALVLQLRHKQATLPATASNAMLRVREYCANAAGG